MNCFDLAGTVTAVLQDKTEEFLQRLRTSTAGSHLLLDCLASETLRQVIFGTISSIFDLWSRPLGV